VSPSSLGQLTMGRAAVKKRQQATKAKKKAASSTPEPQVDTSAPPIDTSSNISLPLADDSGVEVSDASKSAASTSNVNIGRPIRRTAAAVPKLVCQFALSFAGQDDEESSMTYDDENEDEDEDEDGDGDEEHDSDSLDEEVLPTSKTGKAAQVQKKPVQEKVKVNTKGKGKKVVKIIEPTDSEEESEDGEFWCRLCCSTTHIFLCRTI
jgi:hypothetical protein